MKDHKGFTLVEVLVAAALMAIGLLALSQITFLTLKQNQRAIDKTSAVNILQTIAEKDLRRIKQMYDCNIDHIRDGGTYSCNTSILGAGVACPQYCNPFRTINTDPTRTEKQCFSITPSTSEVPIQSTPESDCKTITPKTDFYVLREVKQPSDGKYEITYAVKSLNQVDQASTSLELKDTISRHYMVVESTETVTNLGAKIIIPSLP